MLAGCATAAAALSEGERLPAADDGSHFLRWFYEWKGDYFAEKGQSFAEIRAEKRARLGVPPTLPSEHDGLPAA